MVWGEGRQRDEMMIGEGRRGDREVMGDILLDGTRREVGVERESGETGEARKGWRWDALHLIDTEGKEPRGFSVRQAYSRKGKAMETMS